jgi:flavin-binding protein dodecin
MRYNEMQGHNMGYQGNGGGEDGRMRGGPQGGMDARSQGPYGNESYRGEGARGGRDDRMQGSRGGRDTAPRDDESDAVVKVIEVLAQSDRGWEDAAQRAVDQASKSVRNIRSLYVKDMQAVVRDGRITQYRITGKLSFVLDDGQDYGDRRNR